MGNAMPSAPGDDKAPEYKYWTFISLSHQDEK